MLHTRALSSSPKPPHWRLRTGTIFNSNKNSAAGVADTLTKVGGAAAVAPSTTFKYVKYAAVAVGVVGVAVGVILYNVKREMEERDKVNESEKFKTMLEWRQGWKLMEKGKIDEARVFFHKPIERCSSIFGEDDKACMKRMNELGCLLYHGKAPEVVVQDIKFLDGPNKLDAVPISLHTILKEAEFVFRRCLEVRERVQGKEHKETLKTMNNLRLTLLKQYHSQSYYLWPSSAKLDEARFLNEKIMEVREKLIQEEDFKLKKLLNSKKPTRLKSAQGEVVNINVRPN